MALSPKMLAVLQKVDAARAAYFEKMRAKNVEDRARIAKTEKALSSGRRAAQARSAKAKPPLKKSPLKNRPITKRPTALKAARARWAKAKKKSGS